MKKHLKICCLWHRESVTKKVRETIKIKKVVENLLDMCYDVTQERAVCKETVRKDLCSTA